MKEICNELFLAVEKDNLNEIMNFRENALRNQYDEQLCADILSICESYLARNFQYTFINQDGKNAIKNYCFRLRVKDSLNYRISIQLSGSINSAFLVKNKTLVEVEICNSIIEINEDLNQLDGILLDGDFYKLNKVEIPSVMFGKDDWLFLINDRNDSLGQYSGKRFISNEEIERWSQFLLETKKIKNLKVIIAPSKETVFNKFYPYAGFDSKILLQLKKVDRSTNIVVDPTQALQKDSRSYSKTDTHWSFYGAFIALKEAFPDLIEGTNFQFVTGQKVGDIGSKFLPNLKSDFEYILNPEDSKYKIFDNFLSQDGHISVYHNEAASSKYKVVLFGDSFSRFFYPILCKTFRRVVCIRSAGSIIRDVLTHEKPDFVIIERAERFSLTAPSIHRTISECPAMTKYADNMKNNRERIFESIKFLDKDNPIVSFIEEILK